MNHPSSSPIIRIHPTGMIISNIVWLKFFEFHYTEFKKCIQFLTRQSDELCQVIRQINKWQKPITDEQQSDLNTRLTQLQQTFTKLHSELKHIKHPRSLIINHTDQFTAHYLLANPWYQKGYITELDPRSIILTFDPREYQTAYREYASKQKITHPYPNEAHLCSEQEYIQFMEETRQLLATQDALLSPTIMGRRFTCDKTT